MRRAFCFQEAAMDPNDLAARLVGFGLLAVIAAACALYAPFLFRRRK